MDQEAFRSYLISRKLPEEKLEAAVALALRFETALEGNETPSKTDIWNFCDQLIDCHENSEENFITLARYGLFSQNNLIYVTILELLDGGEAQQNLFNRVALIHGNALRDRVFDGIGVAPYGTPTIRKPALMHPVIHRLATEIGEEACINLLADSLRDLPDELYSKEREIFLSCKDVDAYLVKKKENFMQQMQLCQRENRLFFAQEVTDAVLAYIESQPEMGGGVRAGKIVYETKIPFMTREYLAETDDTLKRYYYCHCPWSREAIKHGGKVTAVFCNCSAGFHKKPWQAALNQPVRVEVLESVLKGDSRCRFAIHLPE